MGNSEVIQFKISDWSLLKNSNIYRNNNSQQKIYQALVEYPNLQTLQENLKIYLTRSSGNVVRIYHFQYVPVQSWICTSDPQVKVFVQYIHTTLFHCATFQQHQIIHLLQNVLLGYQQIFQKSITYFEITDKMIGFNSLGQIKVWINQIFQYNNPSELPQIHINSQKQIKQHYLVKRILDVIQKHCQKRKYSLQLVKSIEWNKLSFQKSIAAINKYKQLVIDKNIKFDSISQNSVETKTVKKRGLSLSDPKKGLNLSDSKIRSKFQQVTRNNYKFIR